MDWAEESTRRLAEAAKLRQEMQTIGDQLLVIQEKQRRKRKSYHDLQHQYSTARQAARLEWAQSEEAQSPDPRTGRSNPEWRKLLWAKAEQENEELVSLSQAVELAEQELGQLEAEVQELKARFRTAFEQANILQSELICLAALVGQG
jgi:predicted HTH domain antitoxin